MSRLGAANIRAMGMAMSGKSSDEIRADAKKIMVSWVTTYLPKAGQNMPTVKTWRQISNKNHLTTVWTSDGNL